MANVLVFRCLYFAFILHMYLPSLNRSLSFFSLLVCHFFHSQVAQSQDKELFDNGVENGLKNGLELIQERTI